MAVISVDHPLIDHKLGLMREFTTSTKLFRELVAEVATLLTVEATRSLPTESVDITAWDQSLLSVSRMPAKKMTIVPILRAGFGMVDGVLRLMPSARVSVVGLYRNEQTLEPVYYFDKVVEDVSERVALIIDPMLATGGSLIATVDLLKAKGCKKVMGICLLCAPEGVVAVENAHPDVDIYVGAIDQHLNEQGYIIPGLGDAGDRLFGTS